MLANVAAGDLVRDALMTERVQQPVEYFGRVPIDDGLKDTGFQGISADIIEKRQ